jgi:hypothetical protein
MDVESLVTLDWIKQTQIGKKILNKRNKIHFKKFLMQELFTFCAQHDESLAYKSVRFYRFLSSILLSDSSQLTPFKSYDLFYVEKPCFFRNYISPHNLKRRIWP